MARTKEFDPDVTLRAAMDLFWRNGYGPRRCRISSITSASAAAASTRPTAASTSSICSRSTGTRRSPATACWTAVRAGTGTAGRTRAGARVPRRRADRAERLPGHQHRRRMRRVTGRSRGGWSPTGTAWRRESPARSSGPEAGRTRGGQGSARARPVSRDVGAGPQGHGQGARRAPYARRRRPGVVAARLSGFFHAFYLERSFKIGVEMTMRRRTVLGAGWASRRAGAGRTGRGRAGPRAVAARLPRRVRHGQRRPAALRHGRQGAPLVLLPGWPRTWWEFHKIMPALARTRRVIAVDLRGMGDSAKPAGGYDKKTMAADISRADREARPRPRPTCSAPTSARWSRSAWPPTIRSGSASS